MRAEQNRLWSQLESNKCTKVCLPFGSVGKTGAQQAVKGFPEGVGRVPEGSEDIG
jgi:hypothetical protein